MGVNESQINLDEVVSELLSELPTNSDISIELPSGGLAKIRPITFEEEKQMIAVSKKGQDPSYLLIDKCVSDIDKSDILIIDKIYILFKLRELSFGSMYKFRVACPSCKNQSEISIDINEMPVYSVEDADKVAEVELPMCKKLVKVKRASVNDEALVSDSYKMLDNLWRFVEEFGGRTEKAVIQSVISKLPAGDVNKLISVVMCQGYGLSTEIMFNCGHCQHQSKMELPLDKNFFSAS